MESVVRSPVMLSVQMEEAIRSISPAPTSHHLLSPQPSPQLAKQGSPLSRKKDWFNRCIRRGALEGFPDGCQVVEGAIFLKNEDISNHEIIITTNDSIPHLAETTESAPESPIAACQSLNTSKFFDIKIPLSRRFPNWFSFFYPQSSSAPSSPTESQKSSPDSNSPHLADVETELVLHKTTPVLQPRSAPSSTAMPTKGILKPSKSIPEIAVMGMDYIPKPINKYEFLQHLREREIDMIEFIEDDDVEEERPRRIVFLEHKTVIETHSKEDYNRSAIDYVARNLTPSLATIIKKELNEIKAEMEVHELSRHLTQFYQVK